MTKRAAALVCAYGLAAIAVLLGLLFQQRAETRTRDYVIGAVYQRAFAGLVTSVNELDNSLQKAVYATSPAMTSSMCTDVFGKAMAAQTSLGELPFSDVDLTQTAGFISQIGDWAWLLSKNAASGATLSDEDRQNLRAMSTAAGNLNKSLTELQADVSDGVVSIADASRLSQATSGFGESFKLIETEFPEIPTLIYDGPFSSHIARRQPVSLEGQAEVDVETAKAAAAAFMGTDTAELMAETGGNLPCYMFTGGNRTVSVTRKGGAVLSMLGGQHDGTAGGVSPEEAAQIAAKFLEIHGYRDMQRSYTVADGITLVSFAWTENGVICYPDLVKVGVARDGTVVSFEAGGYVMNHRQRNLNAPAVTVEQARAQVPTDLKVIREGLAVIPTNGQNETFCHEFICQNSDGHHYIVYVGADSGQQEKILILIEDATGTLTV